MGLFKKIKARTRDEPLPTGRQTAVNSRYSSHPLTE